MGQGPVKPHPENPPVEDRADVALAEGSLSVAQAERRGDKIRHRGQAKARARDTSGVKSAKMLALMPRSTLSAPP